MGISFRFYAFPEAGLLRRIPMRIANDLGNGDETVPEFAGSRMRVARIILEIDDGRPARIMDARGFFWDFAADGRIVEDFHASFIARIDLEDASRRSRASRVVSLVPEIKRKELGPRKTGPSPRRTSIGSPLICGVGTSPLGRQRQRQQAEAAAAHLPSKECPTAAR